MAEYVDVTKLKMRILNYSVDSVKPVTKEQFNKLCELIESEPPVDVVAVVRCKDCVYSAANTYYDGVIHCMCNGCCMHYNGFCYRGRKRHGVI